MMTLEGAVKLAVFLLCVLAVISRIRCQQQTAVPNRAATMRYPHVINLDMEGKYILRWGFNRTHIWFEAQVNALGYVGFGISQGGRMMKSDIVVGYVMNNGSIILADYHTRNRYVHPTLDRSQDWLLIDGREENGWTVIEFMRRLRTCDGSRDRPITRATQRLIYAYTNQDPTDYRQLPFHERRGSKAINLLTMSMPPTRGTANVDVVEFRNNFSVPLRDNSYHCRLFTLAGTSIARSKHHVIKIDPIFSASSAYNVRKITLFRCRFPDMSVLRGVERDFDCFRDGAGHQQHCKEYVASFVHGEPDFYLPEDVGLPFGGPDMADLYVLATEYNNENFDAGVVDTSGLRLWITTDLRRHDAAYLTIASPIADRWYQFIPSGDPDFVQRAYCPQTCLKWGFDATRETSITILGAQFQGREVATAMRLRHLVPRGGQGNMRENPWILDNSKYFHGGQSVTMAEQRHRVSASDTLVLECSYNTTQVTANYTLGGWREQDELCRARVLYYPPIPLEGCLSWNMYDTLRDSNGVPIRGSDVFSVLRTVDWRNPSLRTFLKQTLETSRENAQCWSSRQTPKIHSATFSQPVVRHPYRKPPPPRCRGV